MRPRAAICLDRRPPWCRAPFLPCAYKSTAAESVPARTLDPLSTISPLACGVLSLSQLYSTTSPSSIASSVLHHPYIFKCQLHAELRPPDIEASSEFSGTVAGQDGIRQGRNVCSPPRYLTSIERARADIGAVLLMCSLLALDRRVWEQQSASTRLYARDTMERSGAVLTVAGWPLMADCRLQRDAWRSGFDRCHSRGLRECITLQVTAHLTVPALRRWRPCHLLALQVLRRLHRRGPSERRRLAHTPACLLRALQGPMGPLPLPEQPVHVEQGRPGEVHGRPD
jgi:hypothetical protein